MTTLCTMERVSAYNVFGSRMEKMVMAQRTALLNVPLECRKFPGIRVGKNVM